MEAISEDGDQTWARVPFSGTNTGELMGHPPTGRQATWTAIGQCRYADGKLAEHWGVVDLLSMMQQIGMLPPPPGGYGATGSIDPLLQPYRCLP